MALTTATYTSVVPNLGKTMIFAATAATAESADHIDVAAELSAVDIVMAFDPDTGDAVTATVANDTEITIDVAGGETDTVYNLLIVGTRA